MLIETELKHVMTQNPLRLGDKQEECVLIWVVADMTTLWKPCAKRQRQGEL